MAFTLVAFSESVDSGGVLTELQAVPDQHITTDGDDILVPEWAPNFFAAAGIGVQITNLQISSPSLRQRTLLDVRPLIKADIPEGGEEIYVSSNRVIPLEPGEGLRSLASEGGAEASLVQSFVWLGDEKEAVPDGDIETIKCTSTTTLKVNEWSLCTLTLSQQLRAGTYAIVGLRAESAGVVAARLVIPGSPYRPGVLGSPAAEDIQPDIFLPGRLGKWGEFDHRFIPQVEFFSSSADTSETVYLSVIKIA